MKKTTKIETERLFLYPISIEDSSFILELFNTPKFILYVGDRNLKNVEDAENYIRKRFLPHYEKFGFGSFIIVQKSDGKKVGSAGVFTREGLAAADIGFSFLPEFEGRGFGYESSKKLLDLAFSVFGLDRLSAITTEENIVSQKLIEKLGLHYIKMIKLPEEKEEFRYYEIKKPS